MHLTLRNASFVKRRGINSGAQLRSLVNCPKNNNLDSRIIFIIMAATKHKTNPIGRP